MPNVQIQFCFNALCKMALQPVESRESSTPMELIYIPKVFTYKRTYFIPKQMCSGWLQKGTQGLG